MKDKLAARIKVAVSEEIEGRMREMVDAELQKINVEKNLNKCREEKGGCGSLKELQNDGGLRLKMERFD
jgi:hypothetical protein